VIKVYFWILFTSLLIQCEDPADRLQQEAQSKDLEPSFLHYALVEKTSPLVDEFIDQVHDLEKKVLWLCSETEAKVERTPKILTETLNQLQVLWWNAMSTYHSIEVPLAIWPTDEKSTEGCPWSPVACRIYSWPKTNGKAIRQQLIKARRRGNGFKYEQTLGTSGLDALEVILFKEIPSDQWKNNGFFEKEFSCGFLKPIVEDLVPSALTLAEEFNENVLNYIGPLADPSLRPNYRRLLEQFIQGFQFLEKGILYQKLNRALGRSQNLQKSDLDFLEDFEGLLVDEESDSLGALSQFLENLPLGNRYGGTFDSILRKGKNRPPATRGNFISNEISKFLDEEFEKREKCPSIRDQFQSSDTSRIEKKQMIDSLRRNCSLVTNDLLLEHPFALKAKEALMLNIEFYEEIFGDEAFFEKKSFSSSSSLGQLLFSLDERARTIEAYSALKNLKQSIDSLPEGEDLSLSLYSSELKGCDEYEFCALNSKAKGISDWFKGPLLAILGKEKPLVPGGDAD